MKKNLATLIFLLSFTSVDTLAQPGDDDHKIRLKYFHAIQDSIQKYPDNLFYKWVRLDLLFSPLFEIQTKPTEKMEDFLSKSAHFSLYIQDSIVHSSRPHYMSSTLIITKTYNPAKTLGDFLLKNQDVLIADLTKLIENNLKFENRFMNSIGQYNPTANKSNFLYKRGQFYYLTGETEKGLNDFTSALNFFPKDDLTKRIQEIAVKTHQLLGCKAYSRTDMIIKPVRPIQQVQGEGNDIYVLEINTLPGLTSHSLVPMAAKIAGLSFSQLLDNIITSSLA